MKDHLSVVRGVLISNSHDFGFCVQSRELRYRYKAKNTQYNVLDLGSHIGLVSYHIAREFPNSFIICVDPVERNVELCTQNLNFHSNHRIIKGVIGATDNRSVGLWDNNNGVWAFGLMKTSVESSFLGNVEMFSLDTLMKLFSNTDNFIVKIDIEGSEGELFGNKNNWDILNSFEIVIVEIHDWMFPGCKTANFLFEWSAFYNRDVCINGENLWFFK
jgi:FkbM family methyltransferase